MGDALVVGADAMADHNAIPRTSESHHLDAILERLPQAEGIDTLLHEVLDAAIQIAGADKGSLQVFDATDDCLRIVASRGFPDHVLKYFEVVRRNTNTTCAAALTRRMRVIVNDVSTSYLFVGTPELDVMREIGVAAAHSTPLISRSGRLCGVITTHFCEPQRKGEYDPAPLDRLAVQLADCLERKARSRIAENSTRRQGWARY
jgi:GAF domain-containing protein